MWTIFTTQLLFGLLALLICYSIGKTIASFIDIKGNFFFRLFVTYIIGITTIVLFYSIIKAHGRTINILLIPFISYLIYYFRYRFYIKPKLIWSDLIKEFSCSLGLFLLIFLYQSWFYFDFNKNEVKTLFLDYYWYASYVKSLRVFGIESLYSEGNYFFKNFNGLMPYHYPELWFTAFFTNLFSNSSVNIYYFSTTSIFTSIFLIGIISLLKQHIKSNVVAILLAIPLLFITGIPIPFYRLNTHNTWGIMELIGQKLSFIYIFILLAFILFDKNLWRIGILLLIAISVFSVTFIPGIFGGLLIYLTFIYIFDDSKSWNEYFLFILAIAVTAVSFIIFYSIFKSHISENYINQFFSSGIFKGTEHLTLFSKLKIIVSNFIIYAIPTICIHVGVRLYLYAFILILLLQTFLKQYKLFLLIFCMLLAGASTKALATVLQDSDQFIEALSAFMVVFIIYLVSKAIQKQFTIIIIPLSIIYYFTLSSIHETLRTKTTTINNDIFLSKLASHSITENTCVVLSFFDYETYNNVGPFNFWRFGNDIQSITQFSSKNIIFDIGNPELYLKNHTLSYSDSIIYYKVTSLNIWRSIGKNFTLESFINFYKIKYFYFKSGVEIPQFIIDKTEKSYISPYTHNKFIKIK